MWTTNEKTEHFDVKHVFVVNAAEQHLSQWGIDPKRAFFEAKYGFVRDCTGNISDETK